MGQRHQRHLPDLRERRHARQHFGRGARQERAEPRQRRQADPVPVEPQGAADLCRAELRISGRARPRALRDGEVVRRAEGRHAAARRHRQEPQGGLRNGRSRRPRRRPEQLETRVARPDAGSTRRAAIAVRPSRTDQHGAERFADRRPSEMAGTLQERTARLPAWRTAAAAGAVRRCRVKRPRHPWLRLVAIAVCAVVLLPILSLALVALSGTGEDWPHLVRNVLPGASATTLLPAGAGGGGDRDRRRRRGLAGRRLRVSAAPDVLLGAGAAARGAVLSRGLRLRRVLHCSPGRCRAWSGRCSASQTIRDYWFPDIRSTPRRAFVLSSVLYPYVYLTTPRRLPDAGPQHRRRGAHARRAAGQGVLARAAAGRAAGDRRRRGAGADGDDQRHRRRRISRRAHADRRRLHDLAQPRQPRRRRADRAADAGAGAAAARLPSSGRGAGSASTPRAPRT